MYKDAFGGVSGGGKSRVARSLRSTSIDRTNYIAVPSPTAENEYHHIKAGRSPSSSVNTDGIAVNTPLPYTLTSIDSDIAPSESLEGSSPRNTPDSSASLGGCLRAYRDCCCCCFACDDAEQGAYASPSSQGGEEEGESGCCGDKRSLAPTGALFSTMLTLFIIFNHWLFYKGQFEPLYNFNVVSTSQNVTLLGQINYIVNIPIDVTIPNSNGQFVLENFTYYYSLKELWNYESEQAFNRHANNDNGSDPYTNTTTNANWVLFWALFLWSGVWPHLKLLLVHILYYAPLKGRFRNEWLWWVDYFGKFSMLDVFCFLILIAFCHLQALPVGYHMEDLKNNLATALPVFLAHSTNNTYIADSACLALNATGSLPPPLNINSCEQALSFVLTHPDALVNQLKTNVQAWGTLDAKLQASAQDGVYYFSSAVWCTLLVSFVVYIQAKVRTEAETEEAVAAGDGSFYDGDGGAGKEGKEHRKVGMAISFGTPGQDVASALDAHSQHPSVKQDDDDDDDDAEENSSVLLYSSGLSQRQIYCVLALFLASVLCIACALFAPIVYRTVPGTVPEVVALAVDSTGAFFDQPFTLVDAVSLSNFNGGASGPDNFLQKDMIVFVLIAPLLVITSAVALVLVPMSRRSRWRLTELMHLAFSFSGWEVLVFALIVQKLTLGDISKGIPLATVQGYSLCKALEHTIIDNPAGGLCLEIKVDLEAFGFTCLLLASLSLFVIRIVVLRLQERRKIGHGLVLL